MYPYDEPAVTIRKTYTRNRSGQWMWRCNNSNCGWVGLDLGSQQAALREACRHLIDAFERHHGMVESSPVWNEDAQRGRATCHCGYEAEEKTETGAEYSIEVHAEILREQLPAGAGVRTA
jgi:phage terminase large subunit GpA-like protein